MTIEVKNAIESSDCVMFLVNEPAIKHWIQNNSKNYISLDDVYFSHKNRKDSYAEIERCIIEMSQNYKQSCFVTYGHPLFLSSSALNVAKKLKNNIDSAEVTIMPGVSSLDCLFCDMEIDPGSNGLQAYEATDMLLYDKDFNINTDLVIWQIGVMAINEPIKDTTKINSLINKKALSLLQIKLSEKYNQDQIIFLHVASIYPGIKSQIDKVELKDLTSISINRLATAYIPATKQTIINDKIYKQLFSDEIGLT